MRRMETVRGTCPYDCPDACGLLVDVEGGRAAAVRGDPEHPYSRGSLCVKMNHYERTVHSPRRLTTPLERTGRKGEAAFRPVSWEAAIARISGRWREIVAAEGAEAILPYSYAGTMGLVQRNAGHAFFHRLGASRLDRTICSPAKGAGWRAVMGATLAPHPDEVLSSDLVVLWGINAAATSVHFAERARRARRAGAEVWLVETYRTPTASLADRVVLVRPGSDGALALGMMHVMARDGLVDADFVRENVQGFEDLRDRVLPDFTPRWAAERTGLAAAEVEDLARRYARARAPFIRLGSGLSRYGNGAMTVRAITCLPALAGAWARPGGGLLASTTTDAAFDLRPVTREDLQPRPTRIVNMNRLGHALTELSGPRIASLYVYTSNPAAVAPDQEAVLRGLARDDLFTVVHERFLTDTARWADLVLPATSSLEHDDLYRSYGSYCIQRAAPAIRPVGEARSNWEVFGLLARAMGFEEAVFRTTAREMVDALVAAPSPMREGMDGAAFAAGRAVELRRPAEPGRRWATPSGRIEVMNPRHALPLPTWLPTHEEHGVLPLRLVTGAALLGLNSSFRERDDLVAREGPMSLMVSPADAAARGLAGGARVIAWNHLGEVEFSLEVTDRVPAGVAVAEGVRWSSQAPGRATVNALTAQRLTDEAGGSTFYDNRIDVRPA
jgi:anaerobic selenocysteine-containing dehydrogenase